MSRIHETFVKLTDTERGGFIPFITAGDPDLATTELLLVELAAAGADIIELGVPFSDPVADGAVIQRASERALQKGVTLSDALRCISNAKQHIDTPIVLFSYLNPLLKFGQNRLAEATTWNMAFRGQGLDLIFLVAPTTADERLKCIAQEASGFIYAVSRAGVTGVRNEMPRDAESLVRRMREVSDLPIAVGFGISTSEQVRQVWRFADAAVIGSAIVGNIEKLAGSPDLVARVGAFARSLLDPSHKRHD